MRRLCAATLITLAVAGCASKKLWTSKLCVDAEPIDAQAACDALYPGMESRARLLRSEPPAWGHRCAGGRLTEELHLDFDAYCARKHRSHDDWRALAADLDDPTSWVCFRTAEPC